jgi:hypothetical protein
MTAEVDIFHQYVSKALFEGGVIYQQPNYVPAICNMTYTKQTKINWVEN